jgi:CheY-like chemotaxis protein
MIGGYEPGLGRDLDGVRVLLVDDDEFVREVMTLVLEDRGAQVIGVATVGDALAELRREQPDVVVSDLGMPGEDGYALIRKIRALRADEGGDVPAVAVTGFVRRGDSTRTIREGFQAHFCKPVDGAVLAAAIQRLVRKTPA